ncbi:unnamed protein product [Kuraishia capsulata CBS 1993]|uniref:Phospholipase n=1 Tax=Kuraishia capsulata CBS 1993 TaxID=1382522 RepID=W6MXT1_9ASCO|nr:uncharacterized protein KUCA_T00005413001 [Kuraishia capsulata CBS 1993]CDK29425.1 unnamed protein product [Kuraishia capsulata CBS 1993]
MDVIRSVLSSRQDNVEPSQLKQDDEADNGPLKENTQNRPDEAPRNDQGEEGPTYEEPGYFPNKFSFHFGEAEDNGLRESRRSSQSLPSSPDQQHNGHELANGDDSNSTPHPRPLSSHFDPKNPETNDDSFSQSRPRPSIHSVHSKKYVKTTQSHPGNDPERNFKRLSLNPDFNFRKLMRRKPKTVVHSALEMGPDEDGVTDIAAMHRAQELISALISGSTTALFTATMFLKDDRAVRRAPLLLQMLGFRLTDVTKDDWTKNRIYRIDLEYGVGPRRLKWTIHKTSKNIFKLNQNIKYNIGIYRAGNLRAVRDNDLPRFPRFPVDLRLYNRDHRHSMAPNQSSADAIRRSTTENFDDAGSVYSDLSSQFSHLVHRVRHHHSGANNSVLPTVQEVHEQYRILIERYLRDLFQAMTLKPYCNKVFRFLQLSPIGVLLSTENDFNGKQGYLTILTKSKAQGWNVGHWKPMELKAMVVRHTPKWVVVRLGYIIYVSEIHSTTPLEVFLVDSSFKIHSHSDFDKPLEEMESDDDEDYDTKDTKRPWVTMTLSNGERSLQVGTRNETQLRQWYRSIETMREKCIWSQPHRFSSFAPVRDKCFAQWFVDARDYFWAASSAMEMAKDVIYIHDWWLSPELYLRRPPNGNQQWRIDRILKRKAEEGVKIFVIVYRNVGNTVVTDSMWTKHSLLNLHPNIHVLRSPNQFIQNIYFWAHHEKLLVIDHNICFMGGIDLCYGRYDTPDHVLTDDREGAFENGQNSDQEEGVKTQIFPGKDYSNPRVKDFWELDKPFEDMYDRNTVPRMPWHDVHMMSCGQVARDLSRHFVQRWNYLLRTKRPSRPTPLLLPPPEITEEEIKNLGFEGTCEIQLLRSSCNWSLGLKDHEQSIQNAYLKLIETSEHFVYIENQFFITSAAWDNIVIKNRIGDALVDRIHRAYLEGKPWKAVIVIPLMPGFEAEVDTREGSSVRVIMHCQYMSISQGQTSIFAKLEKLGIRPLEYIQFYSLRKWGRIGKDRNLVTEQLYVHAKTMIVDDRVAIIGSANINERSMRGSRDSEVAAVVRDKAMVETTMNGEPYLAAKFAHSLRMRLMREHLGIDVDMLDLVERKFSKMEEFAKTESGLKAATGDFDSTFSSELSAMVELAARHVLGFTNGTERWTKFISSKNLKVSGKQMEDDFKRFCDQEFEDVEAEEDDLPAFPLYTSFNNRAGFENVGIREKKPFSTDSRIADHQDEHNQKVDGDGDDNFKGKSYEASKKNISRLLLKWASEAELDENRIPYIPCTQQLLEVLETDEPGRSIDSQNKERWDMLRRISYLQATAAREKRDAEIECNLARSHKNRSSDGTTSDHVRVTHSPDMIGTPPPENNSSTPAAESNPSASFYSVVSLSDSMIKDLMTNALPRAQPVIDPYAFEDPLDVDFYEGTWLPQAMRNTMIYRMVFHSQPDDNVVTWNQYKEFGRLQMAFCEAQVAKNLHTSEEAADGSAATNRKQEAYSNPASSDTVKSDGHSEVDPRARLRREKVAALEMFNKSPHETSGTIYDKETAEKLLGNIRGHLVQFPLNWLSREMDSQNWFYKTDTLPPIEIYN